MRRAPPHTPGTDPRHCLGESGVPLAARGSRELQRGLNRRGAPGPVLTRQVPGPAALLLPALPSLDSPCPGRGLPPTLRPVPVSLRPRSFAPR